MNNGLKIIHFSLFINPYLFPHYSPIIRTNTSKIGL